MSAPDPLTELLEGAGGSESQLRETLYRSVVAALQEGIVLQDRNGVILASNDSAERILGLSSDELYGRTSLDPRWRTVHEDGSPFPGPQHPSMVTLRTGEAERGVVMGVHKPAGELTWISINSQPLFAPGAERPCAVVVSFSDITTRKQADESLRQSETRFRSLAESAPCGIFISQRNSLRYVNPAMLAILGLTREEVLARSGADVLPPPLQDFISNRQAGPSGCASLGNLRVVRRRRLGDDPGSPPLEENRWVELSATEVVLDGEPAVVGTMFDVTERQKAEEALRASEGRLQAVLESAGDSLYELDAEGRYKNVWTASEEALPRPRGEIVGRTLAEVLGEDEAATFLPCIRRVLATGRAEDVETRRGGASGMRWRRTRVSAIRLADVPSQTVSLLERDVTAARREEDALRETQKMENLGLLAGGIAHDFNNLLTGILGFADLALLDLPAASPVRASIEQVMVGARSASELTRQLLAYAGKGKYVVRRLRLGSLIREMGRLIEVVTVPKRCQVVYDISPEASPIEGDPTQLRQVAMNLIMNAAEAIGDASGVITVTVGERLCDRESLLGAHGGEALPGGTYVYLEVKDTGHGMSPETLEKIFDPFFTTRFPGRGLGLSAVSGILRGHRGTIKVASEPGNGSTFTALFPATA